MLDATSQPTNGAPPATDYDVVVIGGAFAGASAAVLLRRLQPGCRVLVVERQERHGKKVGEATVEISGMFLTRVLGLYDYLVREQLPKHGLRYWFQQRADNRLEELSDVGALKVSSNPSFQLDRSKLDEHVLQQAIAAGAELLRPAKVTALDFSFPRMKIEVETAAGKREITSRWVIDASGRQCFIARRLRFYERVDVHPTAAAWARFRGLADMDGPEVLGDPRRPRLPFVSAARRLATNHFCGYGYWAWAIPHAGGETSVGVVYDKRMFKWSTEGRIKEQFRHFVTQEVAGLRELLAPATMDEDDFLAYAHLPYRSRQYAGPGWALVGDAGSFMDPYYSPGLDHASMSVWATVRMIGRDLRAELDEKGLEAAIAHHNGEFFRSYDRWLRAIYVDKYELMGDAELTAANFLFDTGMYYLGIVQSRFDDLELLGTPAFGEDIWQSRLAAWTMTTFKQRLIHLARFRRAVGTYGKKNLGWRLYPSPFDARRKYASYLVRLALGIWLGVEREHLWYRLTHRKPKVEVPGPYRGDDAMAPAREPVAAESVAAVQ
ncbi:MAG TPA: tryptophan 7-halogenase [Thermoanaerobaculia bacterium]|jgi:flavin-dependent dehydrogenase|nr:tryptophan 7-halogenase [Thermoanaerobaculia bacterium]